MPSTYTSNNGIEKIGTGEQSGTWGDTTNTNFDIVDRSLNGVGTISLSGTTHTLTTSDGSLSDGQYKVLVLGGSPSGTNTITISPNDQAKFYLVDNQSGQSAVFTQGSGGNATIANGAKALIYADGAGSGAEVVSAPVGVDLTSSQSLSNKTIDFDTTASELQIGGSDVTTTAAELNILDGATVSTAELNLLDGASGIGIVLQVLQTVKASQQTINTTSKTDLSMDLAITPSSATNKILLFLNLTFNHRQNREDSGIEFALYVDDVLIDETVHNIASSSGSITNAGLAGTAAFIHLDSPATTSEVTYSVKASSIFVGGDGSIFYPGTSTLTAMEIVA